MSRTARELSVSGYMGIIREEITEEIEGKPGLQEASRMYLEKQSLHLASNTSQDTVVNQV